MMRRILLLFAALVASAALQLWPVTAAQGAGSDGISVDLVAAGPKTYDHTSGIGGAYGHRTISRTSGVVESLEGGDFACGDKVVFFTAVTGGSALTGSHDVELDLGFLAESTGQPGVFFDDVVSASLNSPDTGNVGLEGNESVTLTGESTGTMGGHKAIIGTVEVTGIDAGDQVIARVVAELGCTPGSHPTGNLQAAVIAERSDAQISVGNQTVPLKNVQNVAAIPAPAIAVSKSCPSSASVGDTITYDITVKNSGTEDLKGMTVTDTILGDLSSSFAGTLSAGASEKHSFSYTVKASDPSQLKNTVRVTATGASSGTQVTATANCTTSVAGNVTGQTPGISIVKTANPKSGAVGEEITYTYVVTNTGRVTLFDITVDDDQLGHIGDIAKLEPGESATLTATHTLEASDTDLVNVGVAVGHTQGGETVRAQDRASVTVVLGTTVTPTPTPTTAPPPVKTPPSGVAFTGQSSAVPMAIASLVLLLLGTGLLFLSRRRGATGA
jgi:uncharacterized repeat protein (TIGR01451 family)